MVYRSILYHYVSIVSSLFIEDVVQLLCRSFRSQNLYLAMYLVLAKSYLVNLEQI